MAYDNPRNRWQSAYKRQEEDWFMNLEEKVKTICSGCWKTTENSFSIVEDDRGNRYHPDCYKEAYTMGDLDFEDDDEEEELEQPKEVKPAFEIHEIVRQPSKPIYQDGEVMEIREVDKKFEYIVVFPSEKPTRGFEKSDWILEKYLQKICVPSAKPEHRLRRKPNIPTKPKRNVGIVRYDAL